MSSANIPESEKENGENEIENTDCPMLWVTGGWSSWKKSKTIK
jgi:hypothetical protein